MSFTIARPLVVGAMENKKIRNIDGEGVIPSYLFHGSSIESILRKHFVSAPTDSVGSETGIEAENKACEEEEDDDEQEDFQSTGDDVHVDVALTLEEQLSGETKEEPPDGPAIDFSPGLDKRSSIMKQRHQSAAPIDRSGSPRSVRFSLYEESHSQEPVEGLSNEELQKRVLSLQEQVTQCMISISGEKSIRRQKDKQMLKLGKELHVRTTELDLKNSQMHKVAQAASELEERLKIESSGHAAAQANLRLELSGKEKRIDELERKLQLLSKSSKADIEAEQGKLAEASRSHRENVARMRTEHDGEIRRLVAEIQKRDDRISLLVLEAANMAQKHKTESKERAKEFEQAKVLHQKACKRHEEELARVQSNLQGAQIIAQEAEIDRLRAELEGSRKTVQMLQQSVKKAEDANEGGTHTQELAKVVCELNESRDQVAMMTEATRGLETRLVEQNNEHAMEMRAAHQKYFDSCRKHAEELSQLKEQCDVGMQQQSSGTSGDSVKKIKLTQAMHDKKIAAAQKMYMDVCREHGEEMVRIRAQHRKETQKLSNEVAQGKLEIRRLEQSMQGIEKEISSKFETELEARNKKIVELAEAARNMNQKLKVEQQKQGSPGRGASKQKKSSDNALEDARRAHEAEVKALMAKHKAELDSRNKQLIKLARAAGEMEQRLKEAKSEGTGWTVLDSKMV